MKTTIYFIGFLCTTLIFAQCKSEDEFPEKIKGTWSLVRITGGLVSLDCPFPEHAITFDFDDDKVVINNTTSDSIICARYFSSGTFDYSIDAKNYLLFLTINGEELGAIEDEGNLLFVNGDYAAFDAFSYYFKD